METINTSGSRPDYYTEKAILHSGNASVEEKKKALEAVEKGRKERFGAHVEFRDDGFDWRWSNRVPGEGYDYDSKTFLDGLEDLYDKGLSKGLSNDQIEESWKLVGTEAFVKAFDERFGNEKSAHRDFTGALGFLVEAKNGYSYYTEYLSQRPYSPGVIPGVSDYDSFLESLKDLQK